jgi:hypothetical protein
MTWLLLLHVSPLWKQKQQQQQRTSHYENERSPNAGECEEEDFNKKSGGNFR